MISAEKQHSTITKKELVYKGNQYSFFMLDFTVGEKTLKRYEAIEPNEINRYGFGKLYLVPFVNQNYIMLIKNFKPVLNAFILEFPTYETNNDENFVNQCFEDLEKNKGFKVNKFEKIDDNPLIYNDPACCTVSAKAIKIGVEKIPNSIENNDVILLKCDENMTENILKIVEKDKNLIILDKLWFFAVGVSLKHENIKN